MAAAWLVHTDAEGQNEFRVPKQTAAAPFHLKESAAAALADLLDCRGSDGMIAPGGGGWDSGTSTFDLQMWPASWTPYNSDQECLCPALELSTSVVLLSH